MTGVLRSLPELAPMLSTMITGMPFISVPSVPPDDSYSSTWSRTHFAGLGAYSGADPSRPPGACFGAIGIHLSCDHVFHGVHTRVGRCAVCSVRFANRRVAAGPTGPAGLRGAPAPPPGVGIGEHDQYEEEHGGGDQLIAGRRVREHEHDQ